MRARRTLRHLTAVTVAALVLGACSNGDGTNAPSPSPTATGTQAFAGTILIGLAQELTGDQAAFGQSNVAGVMAAFSEVNRKGGVLVDGQRYRIEAVSENSESDPTTSFTIAQQFVEDGVLAVVASDFGFEAVYELLKENEVVALTSGGPAFGILSAPQGPENNPLLFSSPPLPGPLIGSWFTQVTTQDPSIESVGILIEGPPDPTGDLLGNTIMPGVAAGAGVDHLITELFPPASTDLSTFLTNIRAEEPDLVFTGLFPPGNIAATTQAADLDVADSLMVFSLAPANFQDLSVFAGKTLYILQSSVVFGRGMTIPDFAEAEARFVQVLGELPPVVAALVNAYGMALALAAGIEAAGSIDDGLAVAQAMHQVAVPSCAEAPEVAFCNMLGGGAMTPGHFLDRATSLIVVEDGTTVTYHLYPSLSASEPETSVELTS